MRDLCIFDGHLRRPSGLIGWRLCGGNFGRLKKMAFLFLASWTAAYGVVHITFASKHHMNINSTIEQSSSTLFTVIMVRSDAALVVHVLVALSMAIRQVFKGPHESIVVLHPHSDLENHQVSSMPPTLGALRLSNLAYASVCRLELRTRS